MLIKELTEINGVSGSEEEVRDYIKKAAAGYSDETKVDKAGNLVVFKKGTSPGFKVMLAAHMDEVGLIVTGYGENGVLRFRTVGGMDERILIGQRVSIGKNKIPGVVGCKPIHLQDREERSYSTRIKSMYIDIGADKKEEAEKVAPLGEYVAFASDYEELGQECIKSKALDDRVGCAVLLEVLKERYSFDLYACFTVQEEIGLRGAEVAAYNINPDLGLVLEGTTCSDVPGVEKHWYSTRLGGGAALSIMDSGHYPDKYLVNYIYNLAQKHGISVQFRQTTTAANDAGKIQRSRGGTKVASISVPCRYIHSPVSIMNKRDFESCVELVKLTLEDLSKSPDKLNAIKNGGNLDV